jgi:hypothetical protein
MSPTKKVLATEKPADVGSLFEKYFTALRKIPLDEKTEHTDRAALQHLLQALAANVKACRSSCAGDRQPLKPTNLRQERPVAGDVDQQIHSSTPGRWPR